MPISKLKISPKRLMSANSNKKTISLDKIHLCRFHVRTAMSAEIWNPESKWQHYKIVIIKINIHILLSSKNT